MLRLLKNRRLKCIAAANLLVLIYQLVYPVSAYALTSGPSQPEMQSFEPVGTTDMVDMFTGNFNYNIPLLDVEGYPINIAYHSGVTMEQESSWVGLGWNINPGNINHMVRGISDDFNGDKISKNVYIKPEKNQSLGMLSGVEFAGFNLAGNLKNGTDNKQFSAQVNLGMNINNYTGVSASFGINGTASTPGEKWYSAGINMGATVNTSDGADFDYSASVGTKSSKGMNASLNVNGRINTYQGLQYTSFGVNPSYSFWNEKEKLTSSGHMHGASNTMIPIGLQNYIPVITNVATVKSTFHQVKFGAEIYSVYPFWGGSYGLAETSYEPDISKNAFGYFNLGNATEEDMVDFTRDKDGRIHRKSKFLPMTNMTYDIYAINGQGTGGNFRGYRNDVGTTYDPLVTGPEDDLSNTNASAVMEMGFGNTFEFGIDTKFAFGQAKSGPWADNKRSFTNKKPGSIYEPVYLKQAGELTEQNAALQDRIKGKTALNYSDAHSLVKSPEYITDQRVARSNLLYYLNGEQASLKQIGIQPQLMNYNFDGFQSAANNPTPVNRVNADRKKHLASEFTQVLPDGRRYIYGLPVMNMFTRDHEFSTSPQPGNPATVPVTYDGSEPRRYDDNDLTQAYSSKTETPPYAHSYMLTTILSPDYADLMGDGITDDDLGSYTKFNYRKRDDYYWRAPYESGTAQYNKGIKSNCNDDKASYSAGKREQWYLHSIESRNFVAEFYTSPKNDAKGSNDASFVPGNALSAPSYKLDSIVLYNKQDRFENRASASPIKTIVFGYNYTLCKGIPNAAAGSGKLTLRSIYVKYGNSDAGYLSPYTFTYYGNVTVPNENPGYDLDAKDCWGNFKPVGSNSDQTKDLKLDLTNHEFPYVNQNDPDNDIYARAWNLKQIDLPSGGQIKVSYESDDYAYVQDKHAMEMLKVEGVGPSSKFIANNSLYESFNNSYRYLYFKRKTTENNPADIWKSYLDGDKLLQYTFDVEISPGSTASCSSFPIVETVKGYAEVVEAGVCDNTSYGYIKIAEKNPTNMGALGALGKTVSINPITLAAINFSRYYNSRALNPEGEFTSTDPIPLINEVISQIGSLFSFYQNPLKSYLKKEKAKKFDINKSYIRLVSQGLKKKGGGHRVKRLEFADVWGNGANYGSDYSYTTVDPNTGTVISSGVASYEPLYGGDENPCRTLLNTDETGNSSKFPPVDPIELLQEAPLGESLYPPPVVGYSRVTVTSIHKTEGESSQVVQENEFYTAKDFPVKVEYTGLARVEDRKPRITDLFNKKDIYRVAQGYTLYLNDMHGKPLKNTVWVDRSASGIAKKDIVSYTKYEYFTNADKTLKNIVPCLQFAANGSAPVLVDKTLGEETDISMDTREKEEISNNVSIDFNSNAFLVSIIPVYIPSLFPSYKKQTNVFSSLVNTKVVQRYGIVKTVEDYKKGAVIRAENTAFDPKTGQVLITKVNTERNDNEYSVKFPAYWAYRCMGPAYENIQYEEKISPSFILDEKLYVNTSNIDRYNLGDEILMTDTKFCSDISNPNAPSNNAAFKLWVVGKSAPPLIPENPVCDGFCPVNASTPLKYKSLSDNQCLDYNGLKSLLASITRDPAFLNLQIPFERVTFNKLDVYHDFFEHPTTHHIVSDGSYPCKVTDNYKLNAPGFSKTYVANLHSSYSGVPRPYYSPYTVTVRVMLNINRYVSNNQNVLTNHLQYSNNNLQGYLGYIDIVFPSNSLSTISTFFPSQRVVKTDTWSIGHPAAFCQSKNRRVYSFQEYVNEYLQTPKPRASNSIKHLVLSPYKKGAQSLNTSYTWPQDEKLTEGKLTVIRSGKRNQLGETVQDVHLLYNPITNNQLSPSFSKVINASAKTFTETASIPEDLMASTTAYNNPYVTGQKGNYRVLAEYLVHKDRDYTSSPGMTDAEKGLYNIESFWKFFSNANEEFYNGMRIPVNLVSWKSGNTITQYSPWGVDLEVEDAVLNRHANIMGYDNRTVVATASNAQHNDMLYENFEDYKQIPNPLPPVYFYQNDIRKGIKNLINANSSNLQIVNTSAHTGTRALQFNNSVTFPVPIGSTSVAGALKPFWLRPGMKYVISYWQKSTTAAANSAGGIKASGGGVLCSPTAKTPVIDGWVLYEGQFTLPANATGSMAVGALNGNIIIDDLRMMPSKSNMKCYVYHPVNKRLMAILDENHMATLMEYNEEGKLVRVKKETEKGILTVKESRESLKNRFIDNGVIVNPPAGY